MLRSPLPAAILALACVSGGLRHAATAQAAASDRRTHGAAACRVETPVQWNAGRVIWLGHCKDGYADGLGALRNTVQGTSTEQFLGRVDRGNLRSGVLDTPQGYTAGLWQAGSLADSGDDQAKRNAILAAFEDGARAAEAIGKSEARHDHSKLSHLYTRLAKRLRSQMD